MSQRMFLAVGLTLITMSCRSSDDFDQANLVSSAENNPQVELVELLEGDHSIDVIEIPSEVYAGDSFRVIISSSGGLLGSLKVFGKSTPLLSVDSDVLSSVVAVPIGQRSGTVALELTVTGINWRISKIMQLEILERPVRVDRIYRTDEMVRISTDGSSFAEEVDLRQQQTKTYSTRQYRSNFMRVPVAGVISTFFGDMRAYENAPPRNPHSGVDFAAPKGTLVSATAGGYVIFSSTMPVRGKSIVIDHGSGVFSGYHHLSKVYLAVGSWINAGEYLGEVGSTGYSTGPHLHWEVLVYGTPTDPIQWLEPGLSLALQQ